MTGATRDRRVRPGGAGRRGGRVRGGFRALGAAVMLAGGVLAGGVLAGCGSQETGGGGRVVGDTVSVVSLLPLSGPEAPVARDLVRGEKLALAQAGGRIGEHEVTMRVIDDAGDGEAGPRAAAQATRMALADSQAVAVIGSLDFESAAVTVPLLNAAGLLHVSPTVGYRGFTERVAPGEPARWYPSGRRSFRPAGADAAHAAVIVGAVRAATRRERPRIVIERESGSDDISLARAVATEASRRAEIMGEPDRADAVVYVGADPVAAEAVAEDLAREAPGAVVVYGDDLTRAGLERRLSRAARRRAVFVTRAPRPGSTPELRAFRRAYVERFGRAPEPYAALGHAVMRSILEGGIARAGARAGERDRVAEAYLEAPPELPAASAFRLRGARRVYLALAPRAHG